MNLTVINVGLVVLTLAGAAASAVAVMRLRRMFTAGVEAGRAEQPTPSRRGLLGMLRGLVAGIGLGTSALLVLRWRTSGAWNPLGSHLDGLLLIAAMLAGVTLFVQMRPRLAGLSAFTLPLLTFILAWAICAATWTDRQFLVSELHPVWWAIHLAGVYLGTLGSAIAAVAGAMYLVIERRLKQKRDPRGLMRLASLETLERTIIHSATLGFALLTLGLVSGVVIIREEGTALGPGWWYSPKVLLAFAAWLAYAVVMNVRHATVFRGRRAAWLAIGGLGLLLGVYGVATSAPPTTSTPASAPGTEQASGNTAANPSAKAQRLQAGGRR